jgi:hypothetical protein
MQPYIFAGDRNTYLDGPCLQDPGNIPDIPALAHALAQINRFTGHTVRPYSVAEHSLLCCEIARNLLIFPGLDRKNQAELMLACLTHDMHEALIGDLSSPIKHIVGDAWTEFENRIEIAVRGAHNLLGVHFRWRGWVKVCDLIALATEKRDLLPGSGEWDTLRGIEPADHLTLSTGAAPAEHWKSMFVTCYRTLRETLEGENQ